MLFDVASSLASTAILLSRNKTAMSSSSPGFVNGQTGSRLRESDNVTVIRALKNELWLKRTTEKAILRVISKYLHSYLYELINKTTDFILLQNCDLQNSFFFIL